MVKRKNIKIPWAEKMLLGRPLDRKVCDLFKELKGWYKVSKICAGK